MKLSFLPAKGLLLALFVVVPLQASDNYELVNRQAIDRVWSGNYVGFDFLTRGSHQYIAYYDANRQLTVMYRGGERDPFRHYKVDSWYAWDSHNYITMELDADGHLHLLGNMHADRLEYFRTRHAHDIRSLERIRVMENEKLESAFTYPRFLKRDNGELILKYRSGGSGDGSEIYLVYDPQEKAWSRMHEGSLIDGQGLMNAYVEGPLLGPDGRFHMAWIWRDTPDASTNHDISYARSDDLINWEDSSGKPISLPITYDKSDVVDPVPSGGGAINGNNKLGFDSKDRPVIAFHKYDENGNTQVYISRREATAWITRKVTDWKGFRWSFGGTGSLSSFDVRIRKPEQLANGKIKIPVKKLDQWYDLLLDEDSLELIETQAGYAYPPLISEVASSDAVLLNGQDSYGPDLILKTLSSQAFEDAEDEVFYLSWESQAPFRGQARDHILPPSILYLHHLKKKTD
ncbi:BNR repeat-containing protein [Pelagicoccus enzymogenes]|uniref:BNR repeat-containing protein n=1 Tax=Pelagicoccus enzymogenes TaxID=2773457 RepID=UPI00280CE202|nr:BNR repeat-containing protein [Pelagicoccus enzymogenes]MDQ8200647.1 BNR repeat-containing protein [Pelagicoccus enzymogenes]